MSTTFILTCLVAMPAFAQERADQAGDDLAPQQQLGGIKLEEADTNPPDLNQPLVVPANDQCAGALTVPAAGPFPHLTATVDLFDATLTGDPTPTCSFTGAPCTTAPVCHSRGIWWTFTPTASSNYRFSTCTTNAPGTNRSDTVLSIYTSGGGCAGPFTEVACNDDDAACGTSNLQSTMTAGLTAGTTYYILAFSWDSTAPPVGQSSVQIQVQNLTVAPPVNDVCAGALTLPLGSTLGTNAGAANDYSLSGAACFGGVGQVASTALGRDSVYSFTAPSAGSYSFRAQTFDAAGSGNIVLYSSPTCPSPGSISCTAPARASNRQTGTTNFAAAEEIFCQPMAAGEQTFVFVDEAAAVAAGGNYLIEATRCGLEVEANNTPATANALLACPMEGTINAGDVDFYSLGSPANGTRVFTIADGVQANDGDFDMRVTNTTDTLEYDDANNVTPNGTLGPNIQGRALSGAASFLRLNHFTAAVNSEPYRLYTVLQPPGTSDLFGSSSSPELNNAGNNTLGGAESAGNYYYNGFLHATNDLDAFKFCAVQGDQISIGIDADPGRNLTPINPAIFLFDELGAQLFGFNDAGATSSNTSGAGNLAATTPNSPAESVVWRARYTGIYYAGINPQAATNIPAASDYLVSIGLNCENASTFTATLDTEITAEFPTVNGGDTFEYTISLSNSGAKTALEVEFVDVLPAGVTFVDLAGTGTDSAVCTQVPAPGSGGTVRCRVDCLRPGGNFDFVLTVRAPQCTGNTTLNNTVNVTSKTAVTVGSVLSDSVSVDVVDTGTCNDGLFCTLGDHCDAGSCVATEPNTCNDSDPCTLDTCEEGTGCSNNFSEGEICDDGDPCTSIDICLAGPERCEGFKPLGSPGEVTGVGFSDKTTLDWGADAAAFTYDAVRGDVSALPVGPGGGDEICFDGISGTSTTDATLPGSGASFWYLVRGENTCGAPAGTWGDATSGPRITTTCP